MLARQRDTGPRPQSVIRSPRSTSVHSLLVRTIRASTAHCLRLTAHLPRSGRSTTPQIETSDSPQRAQGIHRRPPTIQRRSSAGLRAGMWLEAEGDQPQDEQGRLRRACQQGGGRIPMLFWGPSVRSNLGQDQIGPGCTPWP